MTLPSSGILIMSRTHYHQMMSKSKRRKTRQRSSSSLPRRYASKRDLNEDLHRYDASITAQPDLFSPPDDTSSDHPSEINKEKHQERLTRFQRKEISFRRLGHLMQFLFLLTVLVALLILLFHSLVLYF